MGVSNFTGPRESKLTIPRARKMAKHSKIPRIVNEIPGNLRANSQEKAVKLERKVVPHDSKSDLPLCSRKKRKINTHAKNSVGSFTFKLVTQEGAGGGRYYC